MEPINRIYSSPEIFDISISAYDRPDGKDGGYDRDGHYVIPSAMMEIIDMRIRLYSVAELERYGCVDGYKTRDETT